MGTVESRLRAAGLALPQASAPVGSYVAASRSGGLVFTSGQLPMSSGTLMASGHVGGDVTIEIAADCARQCVLNALAAAATVCELDDVMRVVKLVGYVASADGFTQQPTIINGASDVLVLAFGDAGRHAREAIGVAQLPLGAPVEVSLVLEVRADHSQQETALTRRNV